MDFDYHETVFFLVVWTIGFLSGTARLIRDHGIYRPIDIISIGFSGGFFSFGVVAILLRYDPGGASANWFYLGVSALVGSLGKEQDLYVKRIVAGILKNVGVRNDDEKPNNK
jgi:hypothetical protein